MAASQRRQSGIHAAWAVLLVVVLPLLALWRRGMDANWDLRNYHLYNPHAWLHGRELMDIAPAQMQSFHNPLLDVPVYLLVSSGAPALLSGLWLLLPTVVAIAMLLRLLRQLSPTPPGRIAELSLVLLALGGAATWSMLATSLNDPFVAAAILVALALVLRDGEAEKARSWALAGLVAGAMAGLKLTASFYCIALAAAALVGLGWRSLAARVGGLAAGGLAGFLLTYGYWGWHLWRRHGNPVFPYFNHLFQSPDAAPLPWTDNRFKPLGLMDALTSPLQLLRNTQHYSELVVRDPRLALGLACVVVLAVLAWRQRNGTLRILHGRLLAFFVVAWLLWVHQYGIYRYAMALELTGVLSLVLLLQRLPRGRTVVLLAAVVLVNAATRRPDWNHAPWVARAGIVAPALPAGSLVVTAAGDPLAYLALGLPDDVPLVGLANNMMSADSCTRLQARAEAVLHAHRGPVFLLAAGDPGQAQSRLEQRYGLHADGECTDYVNGLEPAKLCRQAKAAWQPACLPPAPAG